MIGRRGQIFLIMTILVITFLVGITTVLIDVQRAVYTNPAPESNEVLSAWELTVDSLTQIIRVDIAQRTQVAGNQNIPDITASFQTIITNITEYLNLRGLTAVISISSASFSVTGSSSSSTRAQTLASFDIFLGSSNTKIQQNLVLDVSFVANVDATSIQVTEFVNGQSDFITNCSFDVGSTTDLENGAYSHTELTGVTINIITPNSVSLTVQVP